jgi:hypothetical protein
MSNHQWNAWLQGHLANERAQNLAEVARTVNELLGPRDLEIAELRKQIAELRGNCQGHKTLRRDVEAPKTPPWTQEEIDRYVMSRPKVSPDE